MKPHIAFLRAVNVGGRQVSMAELRDLFAAEGFGGATTVLQSGNVIFSANGADAALEARLEKAFEARFGFFSDFIVRSAAEWATALKANPYADAAQNDPSHLLVMPLKAAPPTAASGGFLKEWAGPETGRVVGREAFLVYPEGIGRSKLTIAVIERQLGVRGTGRNWNTAQKLLAGSSGA